jgi:hypothetical protein
LRKLIARTGGGLWLGVGANIAMIAAACSYAIKPAHAPFHAGAPELAVPFWCAALGLATIIWCVEDVFKQKWWALLGIAMALTPLPLWWALTSYIVEAKQLTIMY